MNELKDDDEFVLKVEKDPLIGQKLGGRYDVISVLGRGGMGVVYKAHQSDIDRYVALKTLHISRVIDRDTLKTFQSEAQAVSKVRHPHTVMLYDFGVSSDGVPFLVMELLEGKSFRDVLKQDGPMSLSRANDIFQQVLEALSHAHDNGIVHRDLKPENIVLSKRSDYEDWVHVLDFGISGMMGTDAVDKIVGSPPYMSPEQCSMKNADPRSDIYSLAICLYEALSGGFPYQARSTMEIIDCHINGAPKVLKELNTNTSTMESVSQVILKAMEKRPEKRFQSAREFALELDEAVAKDSKRGLSLIHRIELDAPRTNEFVENREEVLKELEEKKEDNRRKHFAKKKGVVDGFKTFFHGDEEPEGGSEVATSPATVDKQNYVFLNCPHCDTPTQEGLSLCLSCGRSLAAKADYSKIRAAKGNFALPKYQEMNAEAAPPPTRGFSQKTRSAMVQGGREWTRTTGLVLISILLISCVFIVAGGTKYVILFAESLQGRPSTPALSPDGEAAVLDPKASDGPESVSAESKNSDPTEAETKSSATKSSDGKVSAAKSSDRKLSAAKGSETKVSAKSLDNKSVAKSSAAKGLH